MTALLGLIAGQLIGHFRAGRENAVAEHAQRSSESQEMDENLEAATQTGDVTEWIESPHTTDYVGVDDPFLSDETYDPLREFDR